mmetsp:Transcript_5601/g.21204  ORF Transcript_5601/g.21204 Transcript_5601/m.21204 type:complete len:200 (+) Transcript_5601:813-1412(+)
METSSAAAAVDSALSQVESEKSGKSNRLFRTTRNGEHFANSPFPPIALPIVDTAATPLLSSYEKCVAMSYTPHSPTNARGCLESTSFLVLLMSSVAASVAASVASFTSLPIPCLCISAMAHIWAPAECPTRTTCFSQPPIKCAWSMVQVNASDTSSHICGHFAVGKSEYVAMQVITPSCASRCAIGANCHFSPTAHTPP